MSREVDQRVVEMQFNNAQFERNTKQSLGTIEKLKAALKFDDAGKSLSGLTKAANKVDLTPVGDEVEGINLRFKALDVVAMTVISRITSGALNMGKRLATALTIDPVKSGLAEYETQINSVQTILANTQKEGTNLAQVNAALDELNRYADMTIYNFTEMTRNIGTFTAAGVKLDTSVQAIKGIANLAAISGSTSMQASTAMYQLSQALAAGTVKLMDWNSVVNAGMGGQVFQDALKETARVHGVAIDEMIAKEGSFRETLQHGWLTASILTETLAKFTGDLSEEELRAIGYTEDQIAAIIKMGQTASDAATKVKTFTQLIDTLKEAVQSGWTQSWEYIIGDFEEAKALWTEISDRLQAVIGASADARNALLEGGLASGFTQFINKGVTDSSSLLLDMLAEIGKTQGAITDEQIEEAGGLSNTFKEGWLSADMMAEALLAVEKRTSELSAMSDEQLDNLGISRDKVDELKKSYDGLLKEIESGNIDLDEFIEKINRPSGRDNLIQSLFNVMDSFGKLIGTIKGAFDEVFPPMTAETLYAITESVRDFTSNLIISDDTADKLRRTFKGLFSIAKIGVNVIGTLARSVGNTVRAVGNLGVIQGAADQFLTITSAVGDFLSMVEEATRGVTRIGDGFSNAADKMSGVREVFSEIKDVIETKFNVPEFETPVKSLAANFTSISKSVKNFGFSDSVVTSLEKLITLLSTSGVSAFTLFSTAVGAAFYVIRDICVNITEFIPKAVNAILELPKTASEAFKEFSDGVSEGANRVISMLEKVMEPFFKLRDIAIESLESTTSLDIYRILSLLDVGLLSVMVGQLAGSTKKLSDVFKDPVTKALDSIAGAFDSISGAVKSWQRQNTIKSIQYVAVAMLALSGALFIMSKIDLVDMAAGLGAIVVMTATLVVAMGKFRKSLADISTGKLVGLAIVMTSIAGGAMMLANAIGKLMDAIKPSGNEDLASNVLIFAAAVSGLTVLMMAVGKLSQMMSGIEAGVILSTSVMIASLGMSLKVMASAVEGLASIDTGLIPGLLTALSLLAMLTYVVNTVDFSKLGVVSGLGLIGLATSLYIVAEAVEKLSGIDDGLAAGVMSVVASIFSMATAAKAMSGLKFGSGAAMVAMAASLLVLYKAIKQYAKLKPEEFAKGGLMVAAALTALTVAAVALGTNQGGILSASVGLIAMGAALSVVAGVIERFAEMDFWKMVQGLVAFAAGLAAMVAGLTYLTILGPGLTRTVDALGKLSLTLLGISAAFAIFSMLDFGEIVGGLVALVGVLGTMLIASALVGSLPQLAIGLTTLGTALSGLSKVFLSFAAAAASLALASAALGVLAMFAGPVAQAIIGAAPDIGEALIVLINTLCNVVVSTIDPILDTIGVVLLAVGTRLYAGIQQLWPVAQEALTTLGNNIKDTLYNMFVDHDYFGFSFLNPKNWYDLLAGGLEGFPDSWNKLWIPNYDLSENTGEEISNGVAQGITNGIPGVEESARQMGAAADAAIRESMDINSPSKVAMADGEYVAAGYAEGIRRGQPEGLAAISDFANAIWLRFRDFWGIHSPSDLAGTDGEFVVYGYAQGMWSTEQYAVTAAAEIAQKTSEELAAAKYREDAKAAGKGVGDAYAEGMSESSAGDPSIVDRVKELMGLDNTEEKDDIQTMIDNFLKKNGDENTDASESGTSTKKTTSSKTEKTPAEKVEEKYKEQLEANKTLQEIADAEYELWMTENQNGAEANEIIAKKLEYTEAAISAQTSRVEIAQAKYDEMVKTVGVDAKEAKEAYADLLGEKTSLAELQADRYQGLYDEILNRLSTESDRIDTEYELWGEQNPGASDVEKTNRKIANITDQLTNSSEQLAVAEKAYQDNLEAYGDADLRTMEAKNELLEAQLDYQKKNNELWQAQLEEFDNALNVIDRESELFEERSDLFSKLYGDGDLSDRPQATIDAIETYGVDSPEAQKARYQGTTSAIMGVTTSLKSMSLQLKKTRVYYDKYTELLDSGTASAEELYEAERNLVSANSAFVGFAENFADAFDMDESGKQITMRLAYAISDNWGVISNGLEDAWSKVKAEVPELAQGLEEAFGVAFEDSTIEFGTSLVSTIVSLMSGDYGGALASGLTTAVSFLGTSVGQAMISSIGSAMSAGAADLAVAAGTMTTGVEAAITTVGAGATGAAATIGGGITSIFGTIGTALSSFVALIPELLPIIAIAAAVALAAGLIISNWDEVSEFLSNMFEGMVDIGKHIVEGLMNGISMAWQGFTSFLEMIFGGVIDFVEGIFGIASPAKKFEVIGRYVDEGFAKGIKSGTSAVLDSINSMSSSAMNTALTVSSKLHDALSSDDWSTEVMPIVDLTPNENSSNWMRSSMRYQRTPQFELERSSKLAESSVKPQIQNGKETPDSTRADIVSAIDYLSDRVVMMGQSIENMQIVLDSKKLVGGISGQMDYALGQRASRARRGG